MYLWRRHFCILCVTSLSYNVIGLKWLKLSIIISSCAAMIIFLHFALIYLFVTITLCLSLFFRQYFCSLFLCSLLSFLLIGKYSLRSASVFRCLIPLMILKYPQFIPYFPLTLVFVIDVWLCQCFHCLFSPQQSK